MNTPHEILGFWADLDAWASAHDPEQWPVDRETASLFLGHLDRLTPLAESGNDSARYAIAQILLMELIYADEATKAARWQNDRERMTGLLILCARNGLVGAFDNLVTSGVGEIVKSARSAADEYNRNHPPYVDPATGMPYLTPEWMEGAMKLWLSRGGGQGAGGPG